MMWKGTVFARLSIANLGKFRSKRISHVHKTSLSGMRPTGSLHLGHYHGVLKNWLELQVEYECLFFVADWHALTTHYDNPEICRKSCLGYGDRLVSCWD